jgi:fructose-1,6-bisphosphatase/inositol monophosphatase family enzyme
MNQSVRSFLLAARSTIGTERLPEILSKRSQRQLKNDQSYVTEGDLLVQQIVSNLVKEYLEGALLVSEEFENATSEIPAGVIVIVVDPVDGTENFTSGLAEWGTSISCFLDGVHLGSLIGCPELGQWIMTGDSVTRHKSRIRGLSSSLNKEEIIKATSGHEYRIIGCCVYNMIAVIRGSFLSFENPKGVWSWDILGGLNIAREHGLTVNVENKPYAGQYLTPDRRYRFKIENQ